jgi:hypothetical protein
MKFTPFSPVSVLVAALFLPLAASAQTIAVSAAKSGQINARWNGYDAIFTPGLNGINFIGAMDRQAPGQSRVSIIAFDLPELVGAEIESATLKILLPVDTTLLSSAPWFNVDLYGFTTPASAADYHAGPGPESETKVLLVDNFLTPASKGGETVGVNVTAFIRSIYTGAKPNVPTVYFRFNGDPLSESYEPEPAKVQNSDGFARYRPFLDRSTLEIIPR